MALHQDAAAPRHHLDLTATKSRLLVGSDRPRIVRMRIGADGRDTGRQKRVHSSTDEAGAMASADQVGFADELVDPA